MASTDFSGPVTSEAGFTSTGGTSTFTGAVVITGNVTLTGNENISGTFGVTGAMLQGSAVLTDGWTNLGQNYAPITAAAIVDNTITTVATITVPNGNISGVYNVQVITVLTGADAYESTRGAFYQLVLARTAGVNLVGTLTPYELSATNPVTNVNQLVTSTQATVAAGGTITSTTLALGSVGGAVGAVNTMTIRVTNVASVAQTSQTTIYISGMNLTSPGVVIA